MPDPHPVSEFEQIDPVFQLLKTPPAPEPVVLPTVAMLVAYMAGTATPEEYDGVTIALVESASTRAELRDVRKTLCAMQKVPLAEVRSVATTPQQQEVAEAWLHIVGSRLEALTIPVQTNSDAYPNRSAGWLRAAISAFGSVVRLLGEQARLAAQTAAPAVARGATAERFEFTVPGNDGSDVSLRLSRCETDETGTLFVTATTPEHELALPDTVLCIGPVGRRVPVAFTSPDGGVWQWVVPEVGGYFGVTEGVFPPSYIEIRSAESAFATTEGPPSSRTVLASINNGSGMQPQPVTLISMDSGTWIATMTPGACMALEGELLELELDAIPHSVQTIARLRIMETAIEATPFELPGSASLIDPAWVFRAQIIHDPL